MIRGDRSPPHGYAHLHASEEAQRIAERGAVLCAQVGSGVHGRSIPGQDGRDEMGLCLEPPQFVTGLAGGPCGRRFAGVGGVRAVPPAHRLRPARRPVQPVGRR